MLKPGAPPIWIELSIDRSGDEIRVSARGSGGEYVPPRSLDAERGAASMLRFADAVKNAAARSKPLGTELLVEAQAAQRALLAGGIESRVEVLRAAAGGTLLVRLMVHDAELQGVPWEALRKDGEALGFWANSPELLPVRGVATSEPWQAREVRGAVRVLAIAPTGGAALDVLKGALDERIASGEIEWLDPIEGPAARSPSLFDRLRREPIPHILHFLGHGKIDEKGAPALRLADDAYGEETWLEVELLAQQLKAGCRNVLRLIVLEACEGARSSAFASAAEILARSGADAVVAHLWPVRADVARTCSAQLYRALTGADRSSGDVAIAMNEARRAILAAFEASAEALSPVLYLRGPDGMIFDFKGRKLNPPRASAPLPAAASRIDPAIRRVLRAPFSLVLGDRWKDQKAVLAPFREKLEKDLEEITAPFRKDLPMSALMQRFALHRGRDELTSEFQEAFQRDEESPPIVSSLARLLGPGVHTTLLRHPWLEKSLAEQQPERTIYVVHRGDSGVLVMKREGGAAEWKKLLKPPDRLDASREILVLRPYRGYATPRYFMPPLLTEDDYDVYLSELWRGLSADLVHSMKRTLHYRPALVMGLSMHTGHHRKLLRSLYESGIPHESVAVIEPDDGERQLWESGAGLPGSVRGVEVVETEASTLASAIEAMGVLGEESRR